MLRSTIGLTASYRDTTTRPIPGNTVTNIVFYTQLRSFNFGSRESIFPKPEGLRRDKEYDFTDFAVIKCQGGHGGNGCKSYLRLKNEPHGGPDGGSGGDGGGVILEANGCVQSLCGVKSQFFFKAEHGKGGRGSNENGKAGTNLIVRVPLNTQIRFQGLKETHILRENGDSMQVARGGGGGKGNFALRTQRTPCPDFAESGEPGESVTLHLEQLLEGDVVLLGLPNSGKSTLLEYISHAQCSKANFPFTTKKPTVGVCRYEMDNGNGKIIPRLVVTDLPPIVKNSSSGEGLGFGFLRHVKLHRVIVWLLSATSKDPVEDYSILVKEFSIYWRSQGYSFRELHEKLQNSVIVINKCDTLSSKEDFTSLKLRLLQITNHKRVLPTTATEGSGIQTLLSHLMEVSTNVNVESNAWLARSPQHSSFKINGKKK